MGSNQILETTNTNNLSPLERVKNLMMDIIGENMGKNKSKEVKIQEVITSAHSQVVQQRRKLKGHWMGR